MKLIKNYDYKAMALDDKFILIETEEQYEQFKNRIEIGDDYNDIAIDLELESGYGAYVLFDDDNEPWLCYLWENDVRSVDGYMLFNVRQCIFESLMNYVKDFDPELDKHIAFSSNFSNFSFVAPLVLDSNDIEKMFQVIIDNCESTDIVDAICKSKYCPVDIMKVEDMNNEKIENNINYAYETHFNDGKK